MWTETRRPGRLEEVMGHADTKQRIVTYLTQPPYKNIMLLYGPPGIGKTTMAIASTQSCGLEPLEINASQSMRGYEDVSRLVQSCQHSLSILSLVRGDKRPTCLILDEIDGSDPHAQRKLVEWMTGPQRKLPILLTCNEVPRIFKQNSGVDMVRCYPPKPADLVPLFPGEDVPKLAKRFRHDVRRMLQFLQYGESDTLPFAPQPIECSPEVHHMLRQKMYCERDPIVLASGCESTASRSRH